MVNTELRDKCSSILSLRWDLARIEAKSLILGYLVISDTESLKCISTYLGKNYYIELVTEINELLLSTIN